MDTALAMHRYKLTIAIYPGSPIAIKDFIIICNYCHQNIVLSITTR